MRDIRSRMLKGSLWISGGRAFDNFLSFISTIVLARLLMPADFGLVALAATTLAIMSAITDLPVTWALIREKEAADDLYHTAWTISMARGLILAALFGLLSWPMAQFYAEPRLVPVMCIMSANLVLTGAYNVRLTIMQKKLIFWQGAALTIAKAVVTAAVAIGVAYVYRSYWAIVAGSLAGHVTSTILSYALVPFRPRISFKHASKLVSFSIWLTFSQAINTLNDRLDHLLVGWLLGRATLGYYSVGSNLAVAPTRESVRPLANTLFPALSAVADDPERLRRGYQRTQALISAIALPAGLGFALVADPAVRLLLGEKWTQAIAVVQVIGAYYAFATFGSLVSPLAIAKGATRLLFRRALQLFVIRVPLMLAGMYFWGFAGLLYSLAVAGVLIILVSMRMVSSLVDLPIMAQLRANYRTLAASAAMAGAVTALQSALSGGVNRHLELLLGLSIVVGAAAYLSSMLLLWLWTGRPRGPEAEALDFAKGVLVRLRRRRFVYGDRGA